MDATCQSFYRVETAALLLGPRSPSLSRCRVANPKQLCAVVCRGGRAAFARQNSFLFLHRSNLYRADAAEKQLLPASLSRSPRLPSFCPLRDDNQTLSNGELITGL